MTDVRKRPTRRQLETLRAYIAAGSIAAAAHRLGITETTARQHLSGLYRRTGCLNVAQAAFLLGVAEERSGPRARHRPIDDSLDRDWSRALRFPRRDLGGHG